MAAAVAATVAEEAAAFGDAPNIGHQNSLSFRSQAGRPSLQGAAGGGPSGGAPSTSFTFPAGAPLVARVVSKVSGELTVDCKPLSLLSLFGTSPQLWSH